MRGIYKITNIKNDNVYIGESLDIEKRWKRHIACLNAGIHENYKIQEDWNKYEEKDFKFEVIVQLDKSIAKLIDKVLLLILEEAYIKKYKSITSVYNIENTLANFLSGKRIDFEGMVIPYNCKSDPAKFIRGTEATLRKRLSNKEIIIKDGLVYYDKDFKKTKRKNTNKNCKKYQNIDTTFKTYKDANPIIIDLNYENLIQYSHNFSKLKTIKEYISQYKLNISYNDLFKFLRYSKIFTYVKLENKKINISCKEYSKYFKNVIFKIKDKQNIRILITLEGENFLENFLRENNLIS